MNGDLVIKLMVAVSVLLTFATISGWRRLSRHTETTARSLASSLKKLSAAGNYHRCVLLLRDLVQSPIGELGLYMFGLALSTASPPPALEHYRSGVPAAEPFDELRDRAIESRLEILRKRVFLLGMPGLVCGATATSLTATILVVQQGHAHVALWILGLISAGFVLLIAFTMDQQFEGLLFLAEQLRPLVVPLEDFDEARKEAAERAREVLRAAGRS